jgi:DNA polymerase-1
VAAKNYGAIRDEAQLAALVDKILESGEIFGFDIETGYDGPDRDGGSLHPDWPKCKVVGISFTNSLEWARYVPLAHDSGPNLDPVRVAEIFWPLLKSGRGVAHNAKFERRHLSRFFREFLPDNEEVISANGYFPVFSDTMIEAYLVAEWEKVGLKPMTKALFGHDQAELISLFPGMKKGKSKALRFNALDLTPEVINYACEDALWALAIHRKLYPRVKDMFLYKVEMEIMEVLCEMEDFGIKYDWAAMRAKLSEAEAFLRAIDAEIQSDLSEWAGKPVLINLGSPKQVGDILYGTLNLPVAQYTDSGAPSTGETALKKLADQYPVVKRILEWREIKTLITRYLGKYEDDYAYAPDGMVHPNHMQALVPSGRFAVNDSPYQQTPKDYYYELRSAQMITDAHKEAHPDVDGKPCKCEEWESKYEPGSRFFLNFRDMIVAPKGYYILGYDYSQVELRVMAGESGEPSLLEAFNSGGDPHTTTASLMLNIPLSKVSKAERAIGKTMNFALLYGMGVNSLAQRLGISKQEGQELYDKYFSSFSCIDTWSKRSKESGVAKGYTISKFGRKFTIWDLRSERDWQRAKGERLCVNGPIQGGAADYMKISMVRARRALKAAGLADRVHLNMNIHDALEFLVEESVTPEEVIRVLAPAVTFAVPGWPKIEADWHIGRRWGTLTDLIVDEHGHVRAKGQHAKPSAPEISEDGELEEVDPDAALAREALQKERYAPDNKEAVIEHQAAGLALKERYYDKVEDDAAAAQALAKTLIVELGEMPLENEFERFREMSFAKNGSNRLILRTPEGEAELNWTTGLSPDDRAEISMLFSGANVYWSPDSVDVKSMLGGLEL